MLSLFVAQIPIQSLLLAVAVAMVTAVPIARRAGKIVSSPA